MRFSFASFRANDLRPKAFSSLTAPVVKLKRNEKSKLENALRTLSSSFVLFHNFFSFEQISCIFSWFTHSDRRLRTARQWSSHTINEFLSNESHFFFVVLMNVLELLAPLLNREKSTHVCTWWCSIWLQFQFYIFFLFFSAVVVPQTISVSIDSTKTASRRHKCAAWWTDASVSWITSAWTHVVYIAIARRSMSWRWRIQTTVARRDVNVR